MSERGPQDWVGDWSAKRASLSPDRVGLVDASTGREYTYADLDERANRCARLLERHGVTSDADSPDADAGDVGGRVAVVSRNRPAYVDLFFATGKTGGVLAPLSHRLAAPELGALLADVDPSLLVVEEPFAELVVDALDDAGATGDCPVLSLPCAGVATWEPYGEALPDDATPYDGSAVAPGDPHLFLHTGGSTGTPKEAVVSHEAIAWNSLNTITSWGLRDDDLTPMVFPMFHTGGWNVLTVPLFHLGGCVVVAREFEPRSVLDVIDERDATVLAAVPAVLRTMVEHDAWKETDLSSLRFVKSGGGPCRESVMDAWWDRGVDLSQGYGLTECGPNNFAMPDDWDREKAHTVGVPNLHVDARVVDDDGEAVETGEVGELELRSPHAAERYWRDDAETAETFGGVSASEASKGSGDYRSSGGWVSTGDLARTDADGYVSVEGRKKNMYVSGGENVYPAEVEDAVAAHPAVEAVVVVPVDDDQWGRVGKAVVRPAERTGADGECDRGDGGEEPLTLDDLRSFLDGRLAPFEHPRRLALVDEIPTSGPSKVDREAVERRFGD